jgi:uncharacterized protein
MKSWTTAHHGLQTPLHHHDPPPQSPESRSCFCNGVRLLRCGPGGHRLEDRRGRAQAAIEYPGGDVPRERGVCTDVVIRALRDALEKDLQLLVHEDMKANFGKYPKIWGLRKTDRNIDHRRVPNLMVFFGRNHIKLPVTDTGDPSKFKPGDLITCTVPPHLPHIMIVSDRKNADGLPLVIHNIGGGAREENRLKDFPLTGHFRWSDTSSRPQQPGIRK